MGMIAGVALTFAVFVYMFWPEKNPFVQADKTRVDYLRERKDVIYENLRDLNFEYQAGKYPEQDYVEQRAGLEDEAVRERRPGECLHVIRQDEVAALDERVRLRCARERERTAG